MDRCCWNFRDILCRDPVKTRKYILWGSAVVIVLIIFLSVYTALTTDQNAGDRSDDKCKILTPQLLAEIQSYQPIVDKIVATAVNGPFSGSTWRGLAELTDKFGARMSGSQSLENAIDYLVDELKAAGLENVHTQNVTVPNWERGYEHAELVAPRKQIIQMIGLGGSVGTPTEGLTANVIAVETFEELENIPDEKIHGNIVLFVPKWVGYGKTVAYRNKGPSIASRRGAIAALVRSITPFSIATPHTGWQQYAKNVTKIPAAAITVEDAEALLRMYRRGVQITLHLVMQDRNLEPAISRNTIAELPGELQRPVVVLSGHLDSWDVGVGAMDDGGGVYISWKALELIKSLKLKKPRRTMRTVLWTAEEQCLCGAVQYAEKYNVTEQEEFNFFFESDMGTFEPLGLDFSGNQDAECIFKQVLQLMAPLNATKFDSPVDAGPDIEVWTKRGFPGSSLLNKNEKYFWWHHSAGDSMLLENSDDLDKNTALFAAAAYVIADLSIDMPKTVTPPVPFKID